MAEKRWLDPLGDYLKPRFGEAYLGEHAADWTPELQVAVETYLEVVVSAADYQVLLNELFDRPPEGRRSEQVTFMLAHNSFWDLRESCHFMAVETLLALDDVIGGVHSWQELADPLDAGYWLIHNLSDDGLRALGKASPSPTLRDAASRHVPEPEDFLQALTPAELRAALHNSGFTQGDLTDNEWGLLAPLLSNRGRAVPRARIDGMLYRYRYHAVWSAIPARYGNNQSTMVLYHVYRRRGTFNELLNALESRPEATRLVAWLRDVAKGSATDSTRPRSPVQLPAASSNVRVWARQHGYQVGSRGRLPRDLVAAYRAARA